VPEAFADVLEHANAFSDDLGTDAIARDDGNCCLHFLAFIAVIARKR
jgi:hypothetical protein